MQLNAVGFKGIIQLCSVFWLCDDSDLHILSIFQQSLSAKVT